MEDEPEVKSTYELGADEGADEAFAALEEGMDVVLSVDQLFRIAQEQSDDDD